MKMILRYSVAVCILSALPRRSYSLYPSKSVESSLSIVDAPYALDPSGMNVPLSPQCWSAAIQFLDKWQHSSQHELDSNLNNQGLSGEAFCASLTTDQKEALALELTRCQMERAGRKLFPSSTATDDDDTSPSVPSCDAHDVMDPSQRPTCMNILQDTALVMYNQFFLYVHQVCTRLTEEMMEAKKRDSAHLLFETSRAAAEQVSNILERHKQWNHLHEELHDMHRDMNEKMLEDREKLESQFEENARKLKEQLKGMDDMQRAIDMANEKVKNLPDIESYIKQASDGITYIAPFLSFLVGVCTTWFVTLYDRSRRARFYMVIFCLLETALELLFRWFDQNDPLRLMDYRNAVIFLRKGAVFLQTFVYIITVVLSYFSKGPSQTLSGKAISDINKADLMDSVEQTATKLKKEMMERDERLLHQMQMMTNTMVMASSSTPRSPMRWDCSNESSQPNGQIMPAHSMDAEQRYYGGVDRVTNKNDMTLVRMPPHTFCSTNASYLGTNTVGLSEKQDVWMTRGGGVFPAESIDTVSTISSVGGNESWHDADMSSTMQSSSENNGIGDEDMHSRCDEMKIRGNDEAMIVQRRRSERKRRACTDEVIEENDNSVNMKIGKRQRRRLTRACRNNKP